MYVPSPFIEDRPDELRAIMESCSLPVLVSQLKDANGIRLAATHLPLLFDGQRLIGHVARANQHWQQLDPTAESLAIFSGVNGYVSPSFYATTRETGPAAPTWNYEAVHVYGRLDVIQDTATILEVVTALTTKHEELRDKPWKVTDAPEDFIASRLENIVALVLHISKMIGARKLSQNKTPPDWDGVVAGVTQDNPLLAQRMMSAHCAADNTAQQNKNQEQCPTIHSA